MKGFQKFTALFGFGLIICLSSISARANYGEPFNYYQPAPPRILSNVEKYHLNQGIEKFRQGKYEYAWSDFAFMLHYFPNHPKVLGLIGELSIEMENPERAESYFERALRLYPNESETHAMYGVFLHKTAQYDRSIESYKRAIALNEKVIDYHYNLGLAYYAQKDYKKAQEQAKIAYNKGYPLPGLKDKLQAVSAWTDAASSS